MTPFLETALARDHRDELLRGAARRRALRRARRTAPRSPSRFQGGSR